MRDADIDYSDIPALDKTFLKKAMTAWPPEKKQLTIRLDADVLDWLRGRGEGYQTPSTRILRGVRERRPPRRPAQGWTSPPLGARSKLGPGTQRREVLPMS